MYEQYKAIVAMAELISNPEALKEAAATMSAAISLNQEEIAKRNEYNETITEFLSLKAELKSQEAKIAALNSEYLEAKATLEKEREDFKQEVKATATSFSVRESALSSKESELNTREGNAIQKANELDKMESVLLVKESQLDAREKEILEREKKIEAIVNAGK